MVSILVAVRNEEQTITRCLNSLLNQNYKNYEILIGNDQSTDQTVDRIQPFMNDPRVKLFDIDQPGPHLKGKANVLAQLAKQARGDFFFITDADMWLPPDWIKFMLSRFRQGVGIITGFTGIKNQHFLSKMQNIEWTASLGIIKVISDLKIPVTTMGNNMMVTRKAYQSVGGYESIPFSITEDYELFKQVVKQKNFRFENLLHHKARGLSLPLNSVSELLIQRKRWLKGAGNAPFYLQFLLLMNLLYLPFTGILAIHYLWIAIIFLIIKIIVQGVFISLVAEKAQNKIYVYFLLLYEFYFFIMSTLSFFYFILPLKTTWKGRNY
ncbi:MAG: glycosyltransferase [Candidatus Cyclobacteriaceae bacterium M3_2C_046]